LARICRARGSEVSHDSFLSRYITATHAHLFHGANHLAPPRVLLKTCQTGARSAHQSSQKTKRIHLYIYILYMALCVTYRAHVRALHELVEDGSLRGQAEGGELEAGGLTQEQRVVPCGG
jgi:hypothetical protein